MLESKAPVETATVNLKNGKLKEKKAWRVERIKSEQLEEGRSAEFGTTMF